jgi:asparagine synthase (glutamine-hydrolysing)
MMLLDTQTYLPGDILTKVDRASMGVSLETRLPFLDRNVVEFAWSLPLNYKIKDNQGKYILRSILSRHVPRELWDRPKKGFSVPLDTWLRGPLKEWACELLNAKKIAEQGYFNHNVISKKWEEHQSGKHNWQDLLWNILMFQAWLQNEKFG